VRVLHVLAHVDLRRLPADRTNRDAGAIDVRGLLKRRIRAYGICGAGAGVRVGEIDLRRPLCFHGEESDVYLAVLHALEHRARVRQRRDLVRYAETPRELACQVLGGT
jgi:hypothetical protein